MVPNTETLTGAWKKKDAALQRPSRDRRPRPGLQTALQAVGDNSCESTLPQPWGRERRGVISALQEAQDLYLVLRVRR